MAESLPQYVLVVDSLRVTDAFSTATIHGNHWSFLYARTDWQVQQQNSPACITVTPNDSIWEQWQTDPLWASSAVLFEFEFATSKSDIIDTIQKLITVRSEDGRLFLLRFYSPNTLSFLMKNLDDEAKSTLLGAANAAITSANGTISRTLTRYENPSINVAFTDTDLVLNNQLVEPFFNDTKL